jgi:cell division protein FtsL
MNAAARLVHQNVLSRHLVLTHLLTWRQIIVALLALLMLLSVLSIIYITHTTRVFYADYQHNLIEQNRLQVEHGQLLLERSTWMAPAQVEQVAETKLGMMNPNHKSVVIVHE